MHVRRSSILTLALPWLLACDAASSPADVSLNEAKSGVGAPALVRGSGHVPAASGQRVFTFHARQHDSGGASGSYTIRLTAPGLYFTVDVSCLSVVDNTAWVGGSITDTNASFIQVGSVSYFYAIDNGEGATAPTDVVSTARINDLPGEDLVFCRDRPLLLPAFPIENGNVQVGSGNIAG